MFRKSIFIKTVCICLVFMVCLVHAGDSIASQVVQRDMLSTWFGDSTTTHTETIEAAQRVISDQRVRSDRRYPPGRHILSTRALRQMEKGKEYDAILNKVEAGQSFSQEDLLLIETMLESQQNSLGKILYNVRIDPDNNSIIIRFTVPGVNEGAGIKDLNDNRRFGMDNVNITLPLHRDAIKMLVELLKDEVTAAGELVEMASDYKGITMAFTGNAEEWEEIVNNKIIPRIGGAFWDKAHARDAAERQRLGRRLRKEDKITEKVKKVRHEGEALFATDFGIAEIKGDNPRALLTAFLNARRAQGRIFSKEVFMAHIKETIRLRESLPPAIFDEQRGGIAYDCAIPLRKQTSWEDVSPDVRHKYGDKENYDTALLYFKYCNIQDNMKNWEIDEEEAFDRAYKVTETMGRIKEMREGTRVQDDDTIKRALKYLREEVKRPKSSSLEEEVERPGYTSRLEFYRRGPQMIKETLHDDTHEVAIISLDKIGMGVYNFNAFEREIAEINTLLSQEDPDWDSIEKIGRSAADDVSKAFFAEIDKVKEMIKEAVARKLGKNIDEITENDCEMLDDLGGDEHTLLIKLPKGVLTPDALMYIAQQIEGPDSKGLRLSASTAVDYHYDDYFKDGRKDKSPEELTLAHVRYLVDEVLIGEQKRSEGLVYKNIGFDEAGNPRVFVCENEESDLVRLTPKLEKDLRTRAEALRAEREDKYRRESLIRAWHVSGIAA